jgi:hypothetical protein
MRPRRGDSGPRTGASHRKRTCSRRSKHLGHVTNSHRSVAGVGVCLRRPHLVTTTGKRGLWWTAVGFEGGGGAGPRGGIGLTWTGVQNSVRDVVVKGDNPHEDACRLLSQVSIGAPYVFHPRRYRKGNSGNQQPADLAWVSESCIVLFYLHTRKSKGNRLVSANNHNFDQAKRWMQDWRDGTQNLRGENIFQSFDIPFDPKRHVIVISIINCGGERTEYQEGRRAELGVTMAATLTQADFYQFASVGCSLIDLVQTLEWLRASGRPSEPGIFRRYSQPATTEVKEKLVGPTLATVPHAEEFAKTILSIGRLRSFEEEPTAPHKVLEISHILNDLLLREVLTIVYGLVACLRDFSPPPIGRGVSICRAFAIDDLRFVVAVSTIPNLKHTTEKELAYFTEGGSDQGGLMITVPVVFDKNATYLTPMIAVDLPKGPSRTRQLLDVVRAEPMPGVLRAFPAFMGLLPTIEVPM